MMKRVMLSTLIVIVICITGCIKPNENQDLIDLVNSFNNESLDFNMYYYGKSEDMLHLEYNLISSLDELDFTHTTSHNYIIINNLDSNLIFDLETLNQLKEDIETYNYNLYYFGTTELEKFNTAGFFIDEFVEPNTYSFGFIHEGLGMINVLGTWDHTANEISKDNDLLFLELLLLELKYHIQLNIS